jgi:hypothetical protein
VGHIDGAHYWIQPELGRKKKHFHCRKVVVASDDNRELKNGEEKVPRNLDSNSRWMDI